MAALGPRAALAAEEEKPTAFDPQQVRQLARDLAQKPYKPPDANLPAPLEDLLWEALKDPQCGLSMAETAEGLAEKYHLTRKEVDEVAAESQRRAKQAWDACAFQDEVSPVTVKVKGKEIEFRADEHMRPETTVEILSTLKPYFKKDGLVTAGNASGISDGAAATVITSEDYAKTHGLKPLGRLIAWAVAGVR